MGESPLFWRFRDRFYTRIRILESSHPLIFFWKKTVKFPQYFSRNLKSRKKGCKLGIRKPHFCVNLKKTARKQTGKRDFLCKKPCTLCTRLLQLFCTLFFGVFGGYVEKRQNPVKTVREFHFFEKKIIKIAKKRTVVLGNRGFLTLCWRNVGFPHRTIQILT